MAGGVSLQLRHGHVSDGRGLAGGFPLQRILLDGKSRRKHWAKLVGALGKQDNEMLGKIIGKYMRRSAARSCD